MVQLLRDTASLPAGHHLGIGIDENTALVVTGAWSSRIGTVMGERSISFFDISVAQGLADTIEGVIYSRLSWGDVVDLSTLRFTPAPFKTSMAGREVFNTPRSSRNIFSDVSFEFDLVTESLFKSKASTNFGVTFETRPKQFEVLIGKSWGDLNQFSVLFKKSNTLLGSFPNATGYDGYNRETGEYVFSFFGAWLNISPK